MLKSVAALTAGTFLSGAARLGASPAPVPEKAPRPRRKTGIPCAKQLTYGPGYHWFGYYDKFQFDPTDRFVLSNEVGFEHRSPTADDAVGVGMVDLEDGCQWIPLGNSRAWNWQQGCMLQWVPGTEATVMWNDREQDRFVCHILDVRSGDRRTLPHPVYNVSPDGRWGIAPDFARLNDTRKGYGYAGLPDANADVLAPSNTGIWRIDMKTGERVLLFSLADAAAIPLPPGSGGDAAGPPSRIPGTAKHWFNHLLFSPDGSRLIFLHRWQSPADPDFTTRMFTIGVDGSDPYVLDPFGGTSHFIWRDPTHVAAWARTPDLGKGFYLFQDRSTEIEPIGREKMPRNGHNTYIPGTDNTWILNDTYPDEERMQHPYLYHIPSDTRVPAGHFYLPPSYTGEWRCDTHPRSSRSGHHVCIDSPHNGGRQLFLIEITELLELA